MKGKQEKKGEIQLVRKGPIQDVQLICNGAKRYKQKERNQHNST